MRFWLNKVVDRLLYDIVTEPVDPTVAPERNSRFVAPKEPLRADTPLSLLKGVPPNKLERVVRALEMRRLSGPLMTGFNSSSVDNALADMRPLLRESSPPRTPTVARLAWTPTEPLLVSAADPRPWSIHRAWLRPAWQTVLHWFGKDAEALSQRLAALANEPDMALMAEGCSRYTVPADHLQPLAREAQCLTSAALDCVQRHGIDALGNVGALLRDVQVPDGGGRVEDRFAEVIARLAATMQARLAAADPFASIKLAIDDLLARPSWRDRPDLIEELQFDLGKPLTMLSEGRSPGELATSPAAAFLILLGRSVGAPWPLLEAVRRRTALAQGGGDRRPVDTKASPEVLAFVDDLVGEAERRGWAANAGLSGVKPDGSTADAAVEAARAAASASTWLHGIFGSGFLDVAGTAHKRVVTVREQIAPMVEQDLLPGLRNVILAPVGSSSSQDGGVDTGAAAVQALRLLAEGPDGLRCRAAAAKTVKECTAALKMAAEGCVETLRSQKTLPPARVEAVLQLSEAITPGLGASLGRRFANAATATAVPA